MPSIMIGAAEHTCSPSPYSYLLHSHSVLDLYHSITYSKTINFTSTDITIYYQLQIPSEASEISTQLPCLTSVERANTRQVLGESVDVLSSNQRVQMMGRHVMHVRIIEHITPV